MNTSTSTVVNCSYCGERLPCGICRLTMKQCPKQDNSPLITWASANTASTATVTTGTSE